VVYAVVQETNMYTIDATGEFDSVQMVNSELAKRTLLVVVDIKNKTEVVLANPSDKRVTTVYIDEKMLMVACYGEVYQLKPQSLFISDDLLDS